MGPASPLEILWSAIAFAGCFYAGSNYLQSKLDEYALKKSGANGTARIQARMAIRSDYSRFVTFLGFLFVGIYSMTVDQPGSDWSPARIFIAAIFVGLELKILHTSWADKRDRQRLLNYDDLVKAEAREREKNGAI